MPPKKRAPAKKKAERKKAAPKEAIEAAPPEAPASPLAGVGPQVEVIRDLLERMQQPQPDLEAAADLAKQSATLEQAFRGIRQSAESLQDSAAQSERALSRLRKAAPPKPARIKLEHLLDTEALPGEEQKEFEITSVIRGFGAPSPAASAGKAAAGAAAAAPFKTGSGTPPEPGATDLTSIFKLVSDGLVSAQKDLDAQSVAYVSQIQDPRIQPALFSIPSVKAEAKLALTVGDSSNLIVKLFGSPQDKTNYSESSLSFDIVATPPPPDGLAPLPSFLVAGAERDQVILKATGLAVVDAGTRARATVFRIPENAQKPYLLILRGAAAANPTQVFRVSLDPQVATESFNIPNDANTLGMLADISTALKNWEAAARPGKTGA